jgi:hypothetical protein
VDDEKSAVATLTDEAATDTVAVVVDTVVTWGLATDEDDTDSATAILIDGVMVDPAAAQCSEIEVDTTITVEDDEAATAMLPVDEAVHLIPSEIKIATSDVHLHNV